MGFFYPSHPPHTRNDGVHKEKIHPSSVSPQASFPTSDPQPQLTNPLKTKEGGEKQAKSVEDYVHTLHL